MHTRIASLKQVLVETIAAYEGVEPDQITLLFLHEQREKRFYPNYPAVYIPFSLCPDIPIYLTRRDMEEIEAKIDEALARL